MSESNEWREETQEHLHCKEAKGSLKLLIPCQQKTEVRLLQLIKKIFSDDQNVL